MRLAILCNTRSSEIPNRIELMDALCKKNFKVFFGAIFDGCINEYYKNKKNAEFLPIIASRNNINPLIELNSLFDIRKKIKRNNVDSVIVYGVKNHAAMAIGAVLGGAKNIICVVNGKGNLFFVPGLKGKILRIISFPMLKIAYKFSNYVYFQNNDDAQLFLEKKLVNLSKIKYSKGSGVNLIKFPYKVMPAKEKFLYLSRITPSKGIIEFIEAAYLVKKKYPNAVFDVVGPIDNVVEDSCNEIIEEAVKKNIINYHGKVNNVNFWIENCRYFVYPSYYPEGVPRSVLEALSTGRPIITTNSVGCRDTVLEKKNGFLVNPKDSYSLFKKMIYLIENKKEAEKMGKFSRYLAETKFDINDINDDLISTVLIHYKNSLEKI